MKKIILLLSTTLTLFASQTLWTDIDGDKKQDKIELVKQKGSVTIRCKLTAQNRVYKSKPFEYGIGEASLSKKRGGFILDVTQNREEVSYQFRYEPKVKKIRLIGLNYFSMTGNISHSTSSKNSLNLLTQKFVGEYEYYSPDTEEYKKLPTFYTKYPVKKFYLNSDLSALVRKIAKNSNKYESKACKRYEKSSKSMASFLKRNFPQHKLFKKFKDIFHDKDINILVLKRNGKITVALVKSTNRGFKLIGKNSHIFNKKDSISVTQRGRYISFEAGTAKGLEIYTFRYNLKYRQWYLYKCGLSKNSKTIKLKTKKDFGVVRFVNFRRSKFKF